MTDSKLCSFEGCGKEHHARGYCHQHYCKLIRYGSPLGYGRTKKGLPHDFMNNVAAKADGDECVIWPYSKRWSGRAQINIHGKMCEVHRVVCEIIHGPPPTPKHEAAHSCGKGHLSCVSGNHLSWKTHKENEADKILHGTKLTGENHWLSKLDDDKVRQIRALRGSASNRQIGEMFGVTPSCISMVMTRKKWDHVV